MIPAEQFNDFKHRRDPMANGKATDHHILAVRVERTWHETAEQAVDMFRYDRCHPLSNSPNGWMLVMQPSVKGMIGGFTHKRWESFGFKHLVTCRTADYSMPYEMRQALAAEDASVVAGVVKLPRLLEVK